MLQSFDFGAKVIRSVEITRNGPDWFKQRSIFQKDLSQLKSVQNFASETNDIVREWLHRIQSISGNSRVDYLPELSRLFLERELNCNVKVFVVKNDNELQLPAPPYLIFVWTVSQSRS